MREFNSLFEKLSALDDLTWEPDFGVHGETAGTARPQSPAAAQPGAARPAVAAPAPGPERSRQPAAAAPDPAAHPADAAAPEGPATVDRKTAREERKRTLAAARARAKGGAVQPAPIPAARPAAPAEAAIARATRGQRMLRTLKIATISLLLFGVGLGGVWLALSFPKGFEQGIPKIARALKSKVSTPAAAPAGVAATAVAATPAKPAQGNSAAAASGVQAAASATPGAGKSAELRPVPVTETTGQAAAVLDYGETPAAAPAAKKAGAKRSVATSAGAKRGAAKGDALQPAPVVAPAPQNIVAVDPVADKPVAAAPVADKAAAAEAAPIADKPAAAAAAHYAIQVGACRSNACMDNYRKLLQPLVGRSIIRFSPLTPAPGGAQVQRVRVEPLALEDAKRLRDTLLAADPRFKGAYVVSLN